MPFVSPSLRIALVSLHTSPAEEPGSGDAGGMNVVVLNQAIAIAALGHSVDILTRRSSPDAPKAVRLANRIELRFLDAGPARPVAKGDHENYIEEFGSRMGALGRYDIIHSHHWFSGMAGLPVARARGIPHVQSFHSIAASASTPLSAGERAESPGRMAGEALLARESDAVVAISAAEADTVVTRLGGDRDRIVIVPPGVDRELFHPAVAHRRSAVGYALVAGRLQPLKGFDLAIEAVAAMPAQLRPELVIAGDTSVDFDQYTAELKAIAAKNGIEHHIRFVGPQSRANLAELLRDARVVLVPSHSETYGLIALEAAASGVPVVAAASGGLRESVVDGETGMVLESRDPHVWAEAITTILSDRGLAERLSAAARLRAEHFSWSRSARGLICAYCTLLTSDAGCRPELAKV